MTDYPMSPLMGQMMDQPLLISDLIRHADRYHGDTAIVSRLVEGGMEKRESYDSGWDFVLGKYAARA